MSDKKFMELALKLAKRGEGKTSPNPIVGALVVKDGKLLGKGYHERAGLPHAEVKALRQAGKRSGGATLYVTLEPCCFFGRTPPCTDAIVASGVKKVVIATKDPNPLNNGKGIKILRNNKIRVEVGLLGEQARRQNEAFNKFITKGMPFVTAKIAQSLDGKIATRTGDSRWITSQASRRFVHRLRAQVDAIMVGVNTILRDDPLLTSRTSPKSDLKPIIKVILDSRLRTPLNSKIFSKRSPAPVIIATTERAPKDRIKKFKEKDIDLVITPSVNGKVNLRTLMKALKKKEITSLLIEGGGQTLASALKEKAVDKLLFLVAPKIIGGESAPTSVEGQGIKRLNQALRFKDMKVRKIGPDLLIEGYLQNSPSPLLSPQKGEGVTRGTPLPRGERVRVRG